MRINIVIFFCLMVIVGLILEFKRIVHFDWLLDAELVLCFIIFSDFIAALTSEMFTKRDPILALIITSHIIIFVRILNFNIKMYKYWFTLIPAVFVSIVYKIMCKSKYKKIKLQKL